MNSSAGPEAKSSTSSADDSRSRFRRRVVGLGLLIAILGVASSILLSETIAPPGSAPSSARLETSEEIRISESEEASRFVPKQHHDSAGGSAQFMNPPGYDNSLQLFGRESTDSELAEAAATLHGYLDARVEGNWAAACQYLAESVSDIYLDAQTPLGNRGSAVNDTGRGCAAALWYRFHDVPVEYLEAEADVDVGSLRVKGAQAYLLFTDREGVRKRAGLVRENGQWRLSTFDMLPF